MPGFEEIEAITLINVLRRAELPAKTAARKAGPVEGAHNITVHADLALSDIQSSQVSAMVLPGGLPGSEHLAQDPDVQRLLREVHKQGDYTCAMCAAPMALAAADLHRGKHLTCYPGFESHLEGATATLTDRVVVDGKVVTSRGPGTALEFALTLVGLFKNAESEAALTAGLLVQRPEKARVL